MPAAGLTGGPFPPYPHNCDQTCSLGTQYAHGRIGQQLPWMYAIVDVGATAGGTYGIDETRGIYPPTALWNAGCGGDHSPANGQWVGGVYTLASGQTATVPTPTYAQAQSLATLMVTAAGSGYSVGDTIGFTGGTVLPNGTMSAALVAAVDESGGIVGVSVTDVGAYYNGYLPTGNSTSGGTGATFSFSFTGAVRDFSVCQKRGFKNVAAWRFWHGQFGFIDQVFPYQAACFVAGLASADDGWTGVFVPGAYIENPPAVKYLQNSCGASWVWFNEDGSTLGSGTLASDFSVNPLSGVNTGSGSTTTTGGGSLSETPEGLNLISLLAGLNVNTVIEMFGGSLAGYGSTFPNAYFTQSGNTYEYHSGNLYGANPITDTVLETITLPGTLSAGGTFSRLLSGASYTDGVLTSWPVSAETLEITNTGFDYKYYYMLQPPETGSDYGSVDGFENVQTYVYANATLSTENLSATVYNDATTGISDDSPGLLGYWDLADDEQYPWRLLVSQIMPLMSRNEYQNPTPPYVNFAPTNNDLTDPVNNPAGDAPGSDGWNSSPAYGRWLDPEAYIFQGLSDGGRIATSKSLLYDGSVLGAPLPAGYQGFFDWQYDFWGTCAGGSDYGILWHGIDIVTFNATNAVDLPLNATQWTDPSFSAGNPQGGASAEYSDSYLPDSASPTSAGAALVVIKYAEVVERWSAQNWGRPGGWDKFLVDETQVQCATVAGTVYTVGTGLAAGTYGVWNGSSLVGFYTVGGGSPTTIDTSSATLAFHTPTGWAPVIADGSAWVAPLRWPAAPSLLGRAGVTAVAPDAGVTTFTWDANEPTFGMSAAGTETVVIYGTFMNVLGTETATRTDDGHFTVTSDTDYSAAAWIVIEGAPAWYKNTSYPRGNFVILDWLFDLRSNGEAGRLADQFDCNDDPLGAPTTNTGGGPLDCPYATFDQAQHCLPVIGCTPKVVCWTPNGEVFANGLVIPLPTSFVLDETYGSRWAAALQSTMTDYFYQGPHTPCDGSGLQEDNGSCEAGKNYGLAPMMEAEIYPPGHGGFPGYGLAQNESPAVTSNLWPSPVTNSDGPQAPSNEGGSPGGSEYGVRTLLLANYLDCWSYSNWFLP